MLAVKVITGRTTLACIKRPKYQTLQKMNQTLQALSFYNSKENQQRRLIHTSHANRSVEEGLKGLGCGLAAIGLIGPGIGLGLVFGHMVAAIGRNPSAEAQLFKVAIMGATFCEVPALFAMLIAIILLFS